ncbi:MAG: glycosyltransferase family 39 protein, partial [Anaerolineae bacterium]|nr:glycosyltransferase family 39 protein [Anaerolineae bacterium]
MKTSKQPAPRSLLPTSYFLLLVILLLAAALRFYHLDAQSFWNDEGNSARIAERTLDLILEGAAGDIHPPGYYLLLHYWRALFGQSEFVLRSLSVVAGLVLIVFTYLLGRHLFGEVTGLMAAFLGAISPFAIYYSQEARMYALLAAVSAASTYLLLRFLVSDMGQKPGFSEKTWFLAYVLTTTAGLYIQYAFSFVLLVHNSIFGLWWLAMARRSVYRGRCHREYSWRWLVVWAGTQAVIVALYLPWLPIALRSLTGWSAAGRAYELGRALLDVLRVLSVGTTLPIGEATVALAGAVVLLLVGLWPVLHALPPRVLVAVSKVEGRPTEWSQRDDRVGWLGVASIALYLLLPIVFIFAFDLYKPAWLKFLVVVLPPFYLLLAHGVENLTSLTLYALRDTQHATRNTRCVVRGICYVSLLAAPLPSLHNLYFNPAYARDDYRQIAADVAAALRPGDAVILDAPNQWEVFTYYYPDQDVYPAPYRPGPAKAEAFLTPLIERHRRLFVLYWGDAESDPRRLIETWLAAHTYKASD